ncbi:unnamed protein product, partial [Mesorhabditis spiculigera]
MLYKLAVLASIALVMGANLEDDVKGAVNDVTTTKEGAKYCPAIIAGKPCPSGSFFHYYNCCGNLNMDCCFALQTWVIVVLAVFGVILLASFVLSLIRCVFCRR